MGKTSKIPLPEKTLIAMYVKRKLSTGQIAEHFGCSRRTIRLRLLGAGVKLRQIKDAFALSSKRKSALSKRGPAHHSWKGGVKMSQGYRRIYSPNHPAAKENGGYIMEHRLVMEAHLGRFLHPLEDVHHKNEIKSDNRIGNLELTDRSKHMRHHATKRHAQKRNPK